jgi:molybdopterin-synthase adenylyltransferase
MKYICGQQVSFGKKIYFQGKVNDFDVNTLPYDPNCLDHVSYPEVTPLPISSSIGLQDFLDLISSKNYSGKGAVLDLEGEKFTFVISSTCRSCGDAIQFYKPAHRINDTDAICANCRKKGIALHQLDQDKKAEQVLLTEIGIEHVKTMRIDPDQSMGIQMGSAEKRILDLSLRQLGIPLAHVVTIKDGFGAYRYYEITNDREELMPNILKRN